MFRPTLTLSALMVQHGAGAVTTVAEGDPADTARQSRLCLLVSVGFIVLALAGAFSLVVVLRSAALTQAARMLDQLSAAGSEQVAKSLQSVDLVLQDVDHRIDNLAARTNTQPGAALGSPDVHDILVDRIARIPQLAAIALADREGKLANWSRDAPLANYSLIDRDFVRVPSKGGHQGRLYISAPQISRATGLRTVFISRRLGTEDEFSGAVIGAMPLRNIEQSFSEMTRIGGFVITLLRDDGVILARVPGNDFIPGDTETSSPEKGRLAADHPLAQYGIHLVVSMTIREALTTWRQQTLAIGMLTIAAVACITLMMWALLRQLGAQQAAGRILSDRNRALENAHRRLEGQAAELEQTAVALRHNERMLADRSHTLNTTLEHIDQGIMMVDTAGRVAVYNQRAIDVLGIPQSVLDNQPLFSDVLAYQWRHGEFARVGGELLEFIKAGGTVTAPHHYQRERPNGQVIEIRSLPLPGGGMVRTFTDITARKRAETQIERAALVDDLTAMPNRFSLRRQLDHVLQRHPDSVALLYINLDRFRLLNDALGHVTGDGLLQAFADRLKAAAHPQDMVSRTGGDEFAVVHLVETAQDDSSNAGERLLRHLCEPYSINGKRVTITVSIGIATGASGMTTDTLLRNADIAMYRAKDGGGNQLCRYEPAMVVVQQERFGIEQSLRDALGTPALKMAYQPIISLESNAIAGFEALLRWTDPVRGDISPASFIPIAESNGLIIPLGRSALAWSCAEAAGWSKPFTIAVNLSPAQFQGDDLVELVKSTLEATSLEPQRLELEVTEGMLLQDNGDVKDTMTCLRDLGVSLTLDDFGTGHAGLSYLRRFPFQKFKIDRSFIRNLGRSREADTIVEEMLLLARRLDLRVVAEGVELETQLEHLRRLGCSFVQGYLTGRPVPAEIARTL